MIPVSKDGMPELLQDSSKVSGTSGSSIDGTESADMLDSMVLDITSETTSTLLATSTSTGSLWPNLGLNSDIVIDTSYLPTQSPTCMCEGSTWSESSRPGAAANDLSMDFGSLETAVPYGMSILLYNTNVG